MKRFTLHRVRGNILPLAIIMTLTILLAGIGIATVVLEGSQRAVSTDQSVAAYYMADSGIERQLYEVRKNNQTVSYINTLGGSYFNGGSWLSTGGLETATTKKISSVATSSFAVIDLFDPDNLTTSPGISKMTVTWSKDPACSGLASNMEVSYAYWTVLGGVPQLPSDNDYVVQPKNGTGSVTISSLNPNSSYRVRLRTYDCPAINVVVSLYDNGGNPKVFPGDITLGAEGTYRAATQKIAVTMPKLDVLSGLFGFAIFSECTLVKGTGSTPSCPP
jgi:hypothetical protein